VPAVSNGSMRPHTLVLGSALAVMACRAEEPLPGVQAAKRHDVSLVHLSANPTEYHGELVRVIGFCRLEFEGNALYPHREDFERGIAKNAVCLSVGWPVPEPRRQLSDGCVLVEGTFDGEARGHRRAFSGELRNISRMGRWPPRSEFERHQPQAPRQ